MSLKNSPLNFFQNSITFRCVIGFFLWNGLKSKVMVLL